MANQNKGSSYAKVAKHFGVSTSSVQYWEKHGFDRDWSTEEQEAWRKAYTKGRTIEPPLLRKKLEALNPEKAAAPILELKEARTQKLAKEIERLGIIIAREKAELVPVVEVKQSGATLGSKWSAELDALVGDMPGQLAGLPEAAIQTKLRARIELLKASVTADLAAL